MCSVSLSGFRRDPQLNVHEVHRAPEKAYGQPWQLVRRKRWWRREKEIHLKAQWPVMLQMRGRKFRERMAGKCYNCLAHGHRRAHCLDPVKCWFCKRSGHISSQCNLRGSASTAKSQHPKTSSKRPLPSPSYHPANDNPLLARHPRNDHHLRATSMDCRLSLGSASGDLSIREGLQPSDMSMKFK
jgi:hypothetical protein